MSCLAEWRLFGTREQGQSVLHDGQLTLTKSLNSSPNWAGPRRGRYTPSGPTRGGIQYLDEPHVRGGWCGTRVGGGMMVCFKGGAHRMTRPKRLWCLMGQAEYTEVQFPCHTLKNGRSESGNIDVFVYRLRFNPTNCEEVAMEWRRPHGSSHPVF